MSSISVPRPAQKARRSGVSGTSARALLAEYRKEGNRKALEKLVSANGGILKSIVRRYKLSSGEAYEDLLQVGHVGLMKAVYRYDEGAGASFGSYAHAMIEGEIRHYLRDSAALVKKPRWARSLYAKVSRATARLMGELGRPPLVEEIAREVNVAPEGIRELIKVYLDTDVRSLDEDPDGGADLSAIKNLHHETFALPIEDRIWLEGALQSLSGLQRRVIHLLYYEDLSQTETGEKLGISQRKVSRIAASAMIALRGAA